MNSPDLKLKILIAEDEEQLRQTLTEYFSAVGYQTLSVSDGVEALKLLEETDFDLLLTDIRMPKKTGIDLLVRMERLKRKRGKAPKVIIMTGLLEEGEPYLKSLGADAVIEKPVRLQEIEKTIKRVLGN